jgi:hypothetical protein
MKPKFILALLSLAFTALFLSSCRVVVETEINQDSSGTLRSSVVFSAEEKANFEASPENAGKNLCDNLKQSVEAQAEFVQELHDGETFCTTVRSFASLDELQAYYTRMGNVKVNELKMGFGEFVFDVQVDLTPKDGNEPAPSEWRLTVPGAIGKNNSDIIEDQTLIWKVEPGLIRTLHAESAVGLDRMTLVFIGGGMLFLGIVLGVLFSRIRR